MKLLLDSNIVIYILRNRPEVVDRLEQAVERRFELLLSVVVDYEVRRYLVLKSAVRQLRRFEALTSTWTVAGLEPRDWREAAEAWAQLHRRGRSIEDRDLLIGITSLNRGATLVTANHRHFRPLGVELEDWTVGPSDLG
ncbi:MAG: PIN domain-containing protein [Holophagales bacterium]|nr:PIN domain-containing protein [Holophagales bacterium]